ncbi:hypothetical protein Tsubulata_023395 [Turnera subulata]|uniref:Protein TIC 40, chloroplastic n=1 Tax=Turnera subulata TaxID=218843 RepID=A0A9Q0F8E3_9ROSI|nr:hypothetical protein Tsubulata_023395 [Turnera subulata]
MALLSCSSSTCSAKLLIGCSSSSKPHHHHHHHLPLAFSKPLRFPILNRSTTRRAASRIPISALARHNGRAANRFARVSAPAVEQTASVAANPQPVPTPPSQIGSPLFWIGVGVGLSAVFQWVAGRLKNYAMQQAFKTLANQMEAQNNLFNNNSAFPGSSPPFPFPPASASGPAASQSNPFSPPSAASFKSSITVDVPATDVEAPPATNVQKEKEPKQEPKKYAFVDVSPEETTLETPFTNVEENWESGSSKDAKFSQEFYQNGAASQKGPDAYASADTSRNYMYSWTENPVISMEALEKMVEDPAVQKMLYPYFPEEMRNPESIKCANLEALFLVKCLLLKKMGGSGGWNDQMMDSLKNFDLNSPEVKQQFDQIGLTPEEVISKIMANPDIAMAFQNPRVQQAIMECSQNPLNITKYQNDQEVMDVFNKIQQLFPGASGSL